MTPEREKEIQQIIIDRMSKFHLDLSTPYQSFSFVGLHQCALDIPGDEFVKALKNMEGVYFLDSGLEPVQIPTKYFK